MSAAGPPATANASPTAATAAELAAAIHEDSVEGVLAWVASHGPLPCRLPGTTCVMPLVDTSDAAAAVEPTVLMLACFKRATAIVQWLLASGAAGDVNARDDDAWTALHYAVDFDDDTARAVLRRDDPACVFALVDAGADVNARSRQGTTALQWAVCSNLPAVVDALLACDGTDVDIADAFGETPLDAAVALGYDDIAAALCAIPHQRRRWTSVGLRRVWVATCLQRR